MDNGELSRPRDVLSTLPFPRPLFESGLPALIGLEEGGRPLWLDLQQSVNSHVLVLGAAGLSESALLRTAMLSLALRASPSELQLAAIDGTGCELRVVEALPHAAAPLAERPDDSIGLLAWVADEARRRLLRGGWRPEMVLFLDGIREEVRRQPAFASALEDILRLGPLCGVHVFASTEQRPLGIPWAARTRLLESARHQGEPRYRLLGDAGGVLLRPVRLSVHDLDDAVRRIRGGFGGAWMAERSAWFLAAGSGGAWFDGVGRPWGEMSPWGGDL